MFVYSVLKEKIYFKSKWTPNGLKRVKNTKPPTTTDFPSISMLIRKLPYNLSSKSIKKCGLYPQKSFGCVIVYKWPPPFGTCLKRK